MNEKDLELLIENIKWKYTSSHYNSKINSFDNVRFKTTYITKADKLRKSGHVCIIISEKIIEKLFWNIKDNILLMYDPDNIKRIMLVKNKKGATLQRNGNGKSGILKFKWPFPVSFREVFQHIPDHHIYKDQLFIMWEDT